MTEHAWFRLLVRAIGLLLVGLALPGLLSAAGWMVIGMLDSRQPSYGLWTWSYVGMFAGYTIQVAIGAYLLLGGERLIARCLREVRNRCVSCGYDLSNLSGAACPECGAPLLTGSSDANAPDGVRVVGGPRHGQAADGLPVPPKS